MLTKLERQREATNASNAENLLTTYQELFSKADITVSKLDKTKPTDHWLALEIALKGKTEEDYWSIVDGLFKAMDAEKNKERKNALIGITSNIMSLGERNFDIDWS